MASILLFYLADIISSDLTRYSVDKRLQLFTLSRLQRQIRPEFYCQPAKKMMAIEKLNMRGIVDRTQTLDVGFPYLILSPIPELPVSFSLDFEEVMNQRARDIIRLAELRNMDITVLYSGGIDSTAVLVSLLKNQVDTSRLHVVLTQRSISEYPLFWTETVSKLNYQVVNILNEANYHNSLIATGSLGDQLFGLSTGFMLPADAKVNLEKEFSSDIIEWLTPWLEKSPVGMKTNHDFIWWMRFSLTWQHVQLSIMSKLDLVAHHLTFSHFLDFYGSKDFQLWSILNHDKKIKSDWKSYKYPLKDYIYEYTKDAEYRDNKVKLRSLMYAYK